MAALTIHSDFNKYFYEGEEVRYIYEDEQCVAFDVTKNVQASVHFLVFPKKIISRFSQASLEDEKLLGHLLLVAKRVAIDKGLQRTGYHLVVDEDHQAKRLKSIHIFGRSILHMLWPVGPGCRI